MYLTCFQLSVAVSQFPSGVVLQYRSVLFLVAFLVLRQDILQYCSFVFRDFVPSLLDAVLQ